MEKRTYEEIQSWLVNQIASLTFMEPARVDVQGTFNGFGLSSREAVMLSGDLEDWLGIRISPTIVYEYPTIEALARFLVKSASQAEQLAENQTEAQLSNSLQTPIESSQMDVVLSNLEQISDEEAEALLMKKLARLDETD
jgi:acyl carrier protein